ncbi:MAG: hypothetical protein LBV21_06435 [Candidatus Adiutrix sp.]|nr:hypothetical protein [Candidatus Adiutrix sp.]
MPENIKLEDGDAFRGVEHFEGLGNVWSAILGEDGSFTSIIPEIIAKGSISSQNQARYDDETRVIMIQYPEKGSVRSGALLVKKRTGKTNELYSAYPILEGKPNNLTIAGTHAWSNGVEGVVAAYNSVEDCSPISFYAPFYFRDFAKIKPKTEVIVNLGALAFLLKKAEPEEFTMTEGAIYELQRQQFLEENPGKTEADFVPRPVSLQGSKILLPSGYSCEWHFRCPVLAVEEVSFLDIKFYKLEVDFIGYDKEMMTGYLYVSERLLNGYVPEAGHDVKGIMWLTGSIESQ